MRGRTTHPADETSRFPVPLKRRELQILDLFKHGRVYAHDDGKGNVALRGWDPAIDGPAPSAQEVQDWADAQPSPTAQQVAFRRGFASKIPPRRVIVDNVKGDAANKMIEDGMSYNDAVAQGSQFVKDYAARIAAYIEGGGTDLRDAVRGDNGRPRLTAEVKALFDVLV